MMLQSQQSAKEAQLALEKVLPLIYSKNSGKSYYKIIEAFAKNGIDPSVKVVKMVQPQVENVKSMPYEPKSSMQESQHKDTESKIANLQATNDFETVSQESSGQIQKLKHQMQDLDSQFDKLRVQIAETNQVEERTKLGCYPIESQVQELQVKPNEVLTQIIPLSLEEKPDDQDSQLQPQTENTRQETLDVKHDQNPKIYQKKH